MHVALPTCTIDYDDTGGPGPVLVFLTGLLVGRSMWRNVVTELRANHRCVAMEVPLGAHSRPMPPGTDVSGTGLARLVAAFLERLELWDVTLVGSDWGGAQLVVAEGLDERVGGLVLLPQEAFDNYPPGLPGRLAYLSAKVPGGLTAALQPLRLRAARRAPTNFGWMSKRPVPDDVMDGWLRPALTSAAVRRDVGGYLRATRRGELRPRGRAAAPVRPAGAGRVGAGGPGDAPRARPPPRGMLSARAACRDRRQLHPRRRGQAGRLRRRPPRVRRRRRVLTCAPVGSRSLRSAPTGRRPLRRTAGPGCGSAPVSRRVGIAARRARPRPAAARRSRRRPSAGTLDDVPEAGVTGTSCHQGQGGDLTDGSSMVSLVRMVPTGPG